MKDTLKPGLAFELQFEVTENKTVPFFFPEVPEFKIMPEVLATPAMIALIEWACIQAIKPHLDWPQEQTVGAGFKLSHAAATPPGFTVTVKAKLEKVEGKKLVFSITADDGVDTISEGIHERFIIDAAKFNARVEAKAAYLHQRKTPAEQEV